MEPILTCSAKIPDNTSFALLISGEEKLPVTLFSDEERIFIERSLNDNPEKKIIRLQRLGQWVALLFLKNREDAFSRAESCRRFGAELSGLVMETRMKEFALMAVDTEFQFLVTVGEGMILASYSYLSCFSQKKKEEKTNPLEKIVLVHPQPDMDLMEHARITTHYTLLARDLVNEPPNGKSAEKLAGVFANKANPLGIECEVMGKKKIEALKMGGLLAVNRGSVDPPTFTVMEWKPAKAVNSRPLVLVGKGVTFDTGGMNLKTGAFMDGMKCDMAGAATMASVLMAIAALKLPVHLIALLPATDNRVDGNAYLPGDVITMHDGTTVEIRNTDAEGRLILADALSYAKRFQPMLVLNAATLTGSAMRAIGHHGIVAMQNRAEKEMEVLKQSGEKVYERVVEFPLWEEYGEQLESDIADISNLGGPNGGASVAGKFLEHFTDYPFIHLDIAGPAFIDKKEHYITKGGTGFGVRLLVDFIRALFQL
jgi:leucyl aminopeptidase